jgi:lipopolysaccharide export system permease protein
LATLRPALVLAVLGFLVGEFVSPVAEQYAVSHKALAQGSQSSFTGRGGVWNRDGDTFIHVSAVERGGIIHGVQLLTFDAERRLTRSLRAERGTYQGGQWLLEKVSRTELTQDRAVTDALIQQVWKTEVTPQLLALEAVALDSLPTLQLWPYAQYLRKQGLMYRDVELAFWRKVLQPFAVAGLVLVAMSFIFGPLREGSLGARIFTGVIIGVVFRISQDFFGPASLIFGLPAILAAAAPIGVCWIAGGWLLTRDN